MLVVGYFSLLSPVFSLAQSDIDNKTVKVYENSIMRYEIIKYPSNVTVFSVGKEDDIVVGLTKDPDNLNFGIIPEGGSGKRFVRLYNNKEIASKVKIVTFGNISDLITIGTNNAIIGRNDSIGIDLILDASAGTGNYTGEIDLIIIEPKFNGLEVLLWLL